MHHPSPSSASHLVRPVPLSSGSSCFPSFFHFLHVSACNHLFRASQILKQSSRGTKWYVNVNFFIINNLHVSKSQLSVVSVTVSKQCCKIITVLSSKWLKCFSLLSSSELHLWGTIGTPRWQLLKMEDSTPPGAWVSSGGKPGPHYSFGFLPGR